MKSKLTLILLFLYFGNIVYGQGSWTQKASFPYAGRQYQNGFSINHKGYFAFGCGSGFHNSTTLAEYDPATDTWSQKTSFPGSTRYSSHVFVIDSCAYFICGAYWDGTPSNYSCFTDVWKYNAFTDTWTQLNNFPGTGRHQAFAFSYGGKGYFGLGVSTTMTYLSDFWQYDPTTDTWTQKASFPGTLRKSGLMFSIQRWGYVGLGYYGTGTPLSDIWRYDVVNNAWIQMNDFPAVSRCWLANYSMNDLGYIATGRMLATGTDTKQFWQYNPNTDNWSSMPDFSGIARSTAGGFVVDNKIYCGMGYSTTYLLDFWEFTPTISADDLATELPFKVNVYPNPLIESSCMQIMTGREGLMKMNVYNGLGEIIYQKQIEQTPHTSVAYPVGDVFRDLPSGLYFITVEISGQVKTIKLFK